MVSEAGRHELSFKEGATFLRMTRRPRPVAHTEARCQPDAKNEYEQSMPQLHPFAALP